MRLLLGLCALLFVMLTVTPSLSPAFCHDCVTHSDADGGVPSHEKTPGDCPCVWHHHGCRLSMLMTEVGLPRPWIPSHAYSRVIFRSLPFPDLEGPFQPPRA
ncbi:MAG: hypothetical protein KF865_12695 [Bdellovibrionaceae bacterium]|nr:hypothetical protein [Pseudobdellovibrionaceae bacterium]